MSSNETQENDEAEKGYRNQSAVSHPGLARKSPELHDKCQGQP